LTASAAGTASSGSVGPVAPGPQQAPLLPDAQQAPLLLGLPPVVGPAARLLILGSFPGQRSLQAAQYYAHPRNQFWPILAALLEEPLVGMPYEERLARVVARGIALWDVVGACRRPGSLDASIRDAAHNDFDALFERLPGLRAVAFNGAAAAQREGLFAARGLATIRLPSTSPAHAGVSFDAKLARWRGLAGWIR
jgi:hypoxanthine-DNA glycosylase